jgi:hypothetical protein
VDKKRDQGWVVLERAKSKAVKKNQQNIMISQHDSDLEGIQGRKLLESHYLTKEDILNAVKEGFLVPWESVEADWVRKNKIYDLPERWRRVVPPKFKNKNQHLFYLHGKLTQLQNWSSKSNESHMEEFKTFFGLDEVPDGSEMFTKKLEEARKLHSYKINELIKEIDKREKELDKVWKGIEPDGITKENLMEVLLNAYYLKEQVELFKQGTTPQSVGKKILVNNKDEIKQLIKHVLPEIKTIYSAIKEVGLSESSQEEFQEAALREYEADFDRKFYKIIKKDYLKKNELFAFNISQGPRDFGGKLLKMIVLDRLGIQKGAQTLWKMAKEMNSD